MFLHMLPAESFHNKHLDIFTPDFLIPAVRLAVRGLNALIVLLLLSGCTNLVFQPMRPHFTSPDAYGILYEDVYIKTDDNITLHGWKLLAGDTGAGNIVAGDNTNGSILFFHGNGENISTHFANVAWLTRYGFDVYLFDYRGYGKSGGWPQLDAVIADLEPMYAYAIGQLPEQEKLTVIGHSLGGSLAIYSVAHSGYRHRIKSLITVEAFSDYHEVAQDMLSTSWLTWLFQWPLSFTIDNTYSPLEVVAKVSPVPLLIMHSEQDKLIPLYHAQALYAAAYEPKKLQLVDSDHNHVFNRKENRELLLGYLLKDLPVLDGERFKQAQ